MLPPDDPRIAALLASYATFMGQPLCRPEELHHAPFAILAHGAEDSPIFWYGNETALRLWETDFESFTRMPSRESAEPDAREAREAFLRQVSRTGFATDYGGVRISRRGRRFRIEAVTLWNILEPGTATAPGRPTTPPRLWGQAACIRRWTWL